MMILDGRITTREAHSALIEDLVQASGKAEAVLREVDLMPAEKQKEFAQQFSQRYRQIGEAYLTLLAKGQYKGPPSR